MIGSSTRYLSIKMTACPRRSCPRHQQSNVRLHTAYCIKYLVYLICSLSVSVPPIPNTLQLRVGIDIDLAVLTNRQKRPIILPPHDASQSRKLLPNLHNLTLQQDLGACGDRPHVSHIQRSTDPHKLPKARPVDKRQWKSGAKVKKRRCAASVKVVKPVAVGWLNGVHEGT